MKGKGPVRFWNESPILCLGSRAAFRTRAVNSRANRRLKQVTYKSSEGTLLPLCGALAAELLALPESLKEMTRDFFEIHLNWLQENIVKGQEAGELKADLDSVRAARLIFA